MARAFGITPAGVCQYLTVLRRLPADLLERVEAEKEPARPKGASQRKLLGVAKIERAGERRDREVVPEVDVSPGECVDLGDVLLILIPR